MVYLKVARTVANRIRTLFQQKQLNAGVPPSEVKPLYIQEHGADATLSTEGDEAAELLRTIVRRETEKPPEEAESPFVAAENNEGRGRLSRWARR